MSIKEIKDVKKLQGMLKDEMELRKYTYECCIKAGKELAKNSFAWDGKEKNLVVQAMELNNKYEKAEQKLEKIREFATALCYTVMSDGVVILQKDILKVIDEVNYGK